MNDDLLYLGHMLDMARKARSFVEGKTRAEYDEDEILRLALTYLLQTIGEAARRVPLAFRDAHPEIPWKQITGMRSRIVHDYMSVDTRTVWDTVIHDLPVLIAQLEKLLPSEGEEA